MYISRAGYFVSICVLCYSKGMVITYFGKSYFKLTLGDLTIAINPPAKESKAFSKAPRFGADIALITTHTPETNGPETVTLGDKTPFVIDGPGSYEVRDLFFSAATSTTTRDGKDYINTVYGFELDGIKIGFLGLFTDEKMLSSEAKEIADTADMLFIPLEGRDAAAAYKGAVSFTPNVIIPYDYSKEELTRFMKEGGQENVAPLEKATLKRRDLDGKQGSIIVLTPQA